MNRYNILEQLGDGAFGVVFKAEQRNTGEIVAIKRMKQRFVTWEECLQLREIISLRRLQHPNVIKLKEVVRENAELCMVFEFMEQNIYQIMKSRTSTRGHSLAVFDEREIRSILAQTLLGIQAIHKGGFMHRDLKPENLLTKGDLVKIADFGLAKEIRCRPPFTEYVSTRWYRAPEIVLRSDRYNSPIDIWALGVITIELYLNRPLFPGASDSDQLFKICSVLGAPTVAEWDEGHQLARRLNLRFPNISPTPLRQLLANTGASPAALDLLESMLRFNPGDRPTATQCLQHPFITGNTDGGNFGTTSGLFIGIATGMPHNPFQVAMGVPDGRPTHNPIQPPGFPPPRGDMGSQGTTTVPAMHRGNSPSPTNSPTPGTQLNAPPPRYPGGQAGYNTSPTGNPIAASNALYANAPPPAPGSPYNTGAQQGYGNAASTGPYGTTSNAYSGTTGGYGSRTQASQPQQTTNNSVYGGYGSGYGTAGVANATYSGTQPSNVNSNRGGNNSVFSGGSTGNSYGSTDPNGHNRSTSGSGAHHFGSAGPLDEY